MISVTTEATVCSGGKRTETPSGKLRSLVPTAVKRERGHVVYDLDRDLRGQAADWQLAKHLAERATGNHASRFARELERHFDVHRLVEVDLHEVRVQE